MFAALVFGDGRRAGAGAAGQARDRRRDHPRRPRGARPRRRRLPRLGARALGGELRADLPRRLGRPARAAGPAPAALRAPAAPVRSASTRATAPGVLISRMTNDVEALDQLVTDGVMTLFQSTLTLLGTLVILLRCSTSNLALITLAVVPGAAARPACSSGSPRPTPTGSPARRSARSPPTCRRRCRASASCARSGRSRATSPQFAALNERQPRREHETVKLNAAYFPAVELLSGADDRASSSSSAAARRSRATSSPA